jgi:tRNA(fMet)-specific endonuclease VapC
VSRYCLDTSAYSLFQRGDARTLGLIDEAEWVGVPAIVLGELYAGFQLGAKRERNEATLSEFLANPVVDVLSVDDDVSRQYADIVVDLRRTGTPIPTNDIWIAASAARSGAIVLSDDAHFTVIDRVGSIMISDR